MKNLGPLLKDIEFLNADLLDLNQCLKSVEDIEIVFDLAAVVGGVCENLTNPATMFYRNAVPHLKYARSIESRRR